MTACAPRLFRPLVLLAAVATAALPAVHASAPAGGREAETPAAIVEAAYARLSAQPHRKRERMLGPMAAVPGLKPFVTDIVGENTRQVFEYDLPGMGKLRVERVTAGTRAAVRTIAPGVVARLAKAKRDATVQSARSLLNQVFSAVAAVQTGGLSAAGEVQAILNAAATLKGAADARRLLGEAEKAFDAWQPVEQDDEEDFPMPMVPGGAHGGMVVKDAGPVKTKHGPAHRYTRQAPDLIPGMPKVVETILIDDATGLPLSEETSMDGQPMMRVEYFDVGAEIVIEVPDCLR